MAKIKILAEYDNTTATEEHDWDDFLGDVKRNVLTRLRTTTFFAYGLNLTWRNVAGYTEFTTKHPTILIHKLVPNTSDWSVKIETTDNRYIVKVTVYHHDKPMGEELYLMSQATEKKNGIKNRYFEN